MKEIKNTNAANKQLLTQCGNCWGHQEYQDDYIKRQIDHDKDRNENFISKFVKKYIK